MTSYEIRVGGEIPADVLDRIGEVDAVRAAGTTIEVTLTDEAALWGLIEVLRTAGIEMLEVRRHSQEAPVDP